jgi:hypothetical protein
LDQFVEARLPDRSEARRSRPADEADLRFLPFA